MNPDPSNESGQPDRDSSLGRRNANATQQTSTTRTVVVRFGNEICVNQTSGEGGAVAWQRGEAGSLDGGRPSRSDTYPPYNNEWCNCLAVYPYNSRHILVGSEELLESKDGGAHWSKVLAAHEDHHSLAFDQETPGLVYNANDGGLFSSRDGGTTWPTMSLSHIVPPPEQLNSVPGLPNPVGRRGVNLAMGLITSELRHAVVRAGRCLAAIDHTGFILSENFAGQAADWNMGSQPAEAGPRPKGERRDQSMVQGWQDRGHPVCNHLRRHNAGVAEIGATLIGDVTDADWPCCNNLECQWVRQLSGR
jgi:hypothetical protein